MTTIVSAGQGNNQRNNQMLFMGIFLFHTFLCDLLQVISLWQGVGQDDLVRSLPELAGVGRHWP